MKVLVRLMTPDILVSTHLSVVLLGLVLVPLILKACSYYYTGGRPLQMPRGDDDVAMSAYKRLQETVEQSCKRCLVTAKR